MKIKHKRMNRNGNMDYTQDMNLYSASGYCMPFEERNGDVKLTLGYGEQTHPQSGEKFFHHGTDFATNRYLLMAVADGTVTGIGSNSTHGLYQTTRYGKYEVTYAHLARAMVPFGARVRAGSLLAISGNLLHLNVKYEGEEINPIDFLAMLYGPTLRPSKWTYRQTMTMTGMKSRN